MSAGQRAGCVNHRLGYEVISVERRRYYAHRLAWLHATGSWPAHEIDHIDGDKANNALKNLRDATPLMNKQNLRAAKKSNRNTGLLGAKYQPHIQKFCARIRAGGRQLHLGVFDNPEAAHAAYLEAKRRLHAGCTI